MNARFSIREALAFGFRSFFHHWLFLLGLIGLQVVLGLAAFAIIMVPFILMQGGKLYHVAQQLQALRTEVFVSPEHYMQVIMNSHVILPLSILFIVSLLVAHVLMIFFQLGWASVSLKIHDSSQESYSAFFGARHYIWRGIVVGFIYAALVGLGLFLFVVPGIMFAIMFYFWPQVLVDHNTSIGQTLRMTLDITRGYRWHLLLFALALHVLNILAVLPYSLGLIILIPVLALSKVYAYRKSESLPAVRR